MSVRLDDKKLGKVLYLFVEQKDAESEAALLSKGQRLRFTAEQHESELGWFVTNHETGQIYDALGKV